MRAKKQPSRHPYTSWDVSDADSERGYVAMLVALERNRRSKIALVSLSQALIPVSVLVDALPVCCHVP